MAAGTKWYNNGEVNIQLKPSDPIPEGFVPGMKHYVVSEESKKRKAEKFKQTCLEKYGVENVSQSEEIKQKKIETSIKHYGVENPMQCEEVQNTLKTSIQEKYGVEYSWQAEEVKDKIKQTNLERYGTENPMQSEVVQDKAKQTNLERYGAVYPFQSESIKEKIKQTNLERYNVENVLQSEEIKAKIRETNLVKYGATNPNKSEKVKAKIRETNLKNLGVEYPMQSEGVREKSRKTCQERYGGFTFQSEVLSKKVRETNLERYGVEHVLQSEEIKNKVAQTILDRYGVEHYSMSDEYKEKVKQTNLERYGVPWFCMHKDCRNLSSNNSHPNVAFANVLDSMGIPYKREFNLKNYSYDFKVGNILVEIDPYITHNSLFSIFGLGSAKKKDYHLNKLLTAEKYGYHCIHVFDWDRYEDIINKFIVKSKPFTGSLEDYFLKIEDNSYIFSEYRVKHILHIEQIIKGFIEKHNSSSIKVYSNRSKFPSSVYKSLGFKIESVLEPHCNWYSPKSKEVIVKPFTLELGRLDRQGFVPVFDCGYVCYRLTR